MLKNSAAGLITILRNIVTVLLTVSVLTACGGRGSTTTITTPTVLLTATSTSIASGSSTTITWTSTNSASCTSTGGGGTGTTGSFDTVALTTTTTYTVTCTGAGGQANQSITITVASAPPTVSLSANSTLIAYNTSAILTWSSTNSTSCTSFPIIAGFTGTEGTISTPQLTVTTIYSVTCYGPGGSESKGIEIVITETSIAAAAASWAATLYQSGTITYYCDCGTGAEGGCVAGADTNAGTASSPKQTIASAITTLNAAASNDTVALCKGGAFNAASGFNITRSGCTAGTTCVDLREYTPATFTGTAKPIINNAAGADRTLFSINGNRGGVRFLNLKMAGDNGALGNRNKGLFFYNGAHDVTMGNLDVDNFDLAVHNAGGNSGVQTTTNIKLTGNMFTNNRTFGFLGAGVNADISYNYWDGSGSSTVFDHAIYLGGSVPVTNMQVVGNYVRGQYGPTCLGAPIVAHVAVDGLLVSNNVVEIDAAASTGGCWGIAFTNMTDETAALYHRNATFSGNTVINGGNAGLTITTCPDCIIENNLIIQNWPYAYALNGIKIPSRVARAVDDVNTRNRIRNNTIWFGPNAVNGGNGIIVGTEGTGHIITNNAVYYSASSGGTNGVICFDYPLALADYAFINNNHCYSAASYEWVNGRGSLASWQSYATAYGFDSASIAGVDPMFTASGTDFTPATGSPLISAGNALHGSTLDFTGKTRPSPPAIGAFEP